MCDCFHLAFPNWHAASSGTGGRRLRGPEAATEDDSTCDEPTQFVEGERPRPQGSSPVEEFPDTEKYTDSDKECDPEHDHKGGTGKKTKKSGLGFMFDKRSTPKMSKLKELPSPESGVIVKTAKDGCAEGLVYGGGGSDGIFIKGVVPESPASKSLKLKEGDQILSATVYFDNVSYEDAIQILEHAQAYKMKLCLKRKPDISQTEQAVESDVIPEEELCAPEMREQGKTRRRGDARISWPKFPSFGKGRKGHFKRSHSSSEADEQRKLELSPTTSDTESPIKSQDALKGKKKHKMKLSVLTKRGRISSSEDQETDVPTTGQTSSEVQQTQESDMLSPECLESPSRETPQVYVTENLKEIGDARLETNNQTVSESPQHKVELISIDSTLKTTDLTVALTDQGSPPEVKSPDGKKKKKERSELKMKILGKDKSHKKAKSSPKRLKTLGASLNTADQTESKKSDTVSSTETQQPGEQPSLKANTQVELDVPDVEIKQKSPQKGKEKQKGKQKQDTKSGAMFKLPKVGLSDITSEEALQKVNESEEYKPKIEELTITGAGVKEDPYDKLTKSSRASAQLPKREDIEIPGMEDKTEKTKAKKNKEPTASQKDETVQMLIDVDSVKEAVSKLPGYKLPKVDTSGVPIPEEITVIDANAQRISVKTPTKIIDPKTKHDMHFAKFDITASPDTSKTPVKLPKMRSADLTTEELLFEANLEVKKLQQKTKMQHSHREIKTGACEREDILIPGRESAHIFDQKSDGIKGEKTIYLQDVRISQTEQIGEIVSDVKIPEIDGIEYIDSVEGSPAKNAAMGLSGFEMNLDAQTKADISLAEVGGEVKDEELTVILGGVTPDIGVVVTGKNTNATIEGPEVKSLQSDGRGGKFKMPSIGISLPKMKEPKSDLSSLMKDAAATLPEAKAEVKLPEAPEIDATVGYVNVSLPEQLMTVEKPELEIKPLQIETELDGHGTKFKTPKFGISMPKTEDPKFDLCLSKKDANVKLPEAKAKVKLPEAPKVDISLGSVDVSIPEQKVKVEKPELEIKPLQSEGELDPKGTKFKIPKLGISMPKVKGPEVDLSVSKKATDVTLPEATGKVHVPDVELNKGTAKVEIKGPEFKVNEKDRDGSPLKFKMPTFKIPKFEVVAPNISGEKPDGGKNVAIEEDLKNREAALQVSIAAPSIDVVGPSMEINTAGTENKGKEGKFKMPSLGFSMPKVKGPKVDLSLSKKDVDLPEMKTDINLPKVDLGEVDVSLPDSKVKVPDTGVEVKLPEIPDTNLEVKMPEWEAETGGYEGKIKMPKFGIKLPRVKGPEFDLSFSKGDVDVKVPEADGHVKLSELSPGRIDVSLPEATMELKKPELEIQAPHIELDGQGNKLKMPKFGIKMPKLKGPELDSSLSKKDGDVTSKAKGEVELPDAPKIDVTPGKAQVELEEQESKLKLAKFGVSMPKVKGPEIHLGLSKKEAKVSAPEVKTDIRVPDVELKATSAEVEIKAPQIEVAAIDTEGSSSHITMPDLSFSMPKVKGPDLHFKFPKKDGDAKLPEVKSEVKLPKAPEVDVTLGGVEVCIPKQKLEVRKPELETDLSLSKTDVDVSLPVFKAEVKLPHVEVKKPSAEVEIRAPEIKVGTKDAKGSPLKFKMPSFKLPKFGIGSPSISTEGPDMDKDIKIDGADIKIPEEVLTVNIDAPSIDAKGPSIDIKTRETEHEGKGGKFKLPSLGFEGPNIDLSLSKTDMDVTLPEVKSKAKLPEVQVKKTSAEMEIKSPEIKLATKDMKGSPSKFKMPSIKLPKLGFGTSSVTAGGVDLDKSIKLEGTEITIPEETLTVNIETPRIDAQAPTIDIKTEEIEGKGGKLKMPEFGITVPKMKGPEFDFNFAKKDVDVTLSGVKAEVNLPDTGNVEGSPSKFNLPTVKADAKLQETPGVDIGLGKVEISVPMAKIEIKKPEEEIKPLEIKGEGSEFKIPKFGIKMPKIEGPKFDVSMSKKEADVKRPEMDVRLGSIDVSIPEPKIEVEKPLQIEGECGQGTKFTKPKIKGPEVDLGLSKKDIDVTLPAVKAEVTLPGVDITSPKVEIKGADIEAPSGSVKGSPSKFKLPTFKFPKFGVAIPDVSAEVPDVDKEIKVEGPDMHIVVPHTDVNLPEVKAEISLPEVDVKRPSGGIAVDQPVSVEVDVKQKKSRFSLPRLSFSKPSVKAPEIDVNLKDTNVKIPEGKVEVKEREVSVKPPECDVEIEGQESKFKTPKFGISVPKVTGTDVDLSILKKDIDVARPEVKAEVKLPHVEVKKPHAEVEIKSPEMKITTKDTDGSPSKFKMPTIKLPKFGIALPSVSSEVPDMEKDVKIDGGDIKVPEEVLTVEVAAPKIDIKGPSIDVKTKEPEQERRGSKFRFPSLGFKGPDVDLTKKEVDVRLPEVKAEVKLPDAEVKKPAAEVEIKSPEIKLTTKDTDGSPSKFKMPSFKMPKFGVGTPSVSAEVPDMDKDVQIDGGDIKIPEEVLTLEVAAPKIDIKGPSIDVKSKEPEQERRGSKFRFPSLGFKGPDVDITKKEVDVKLPEVKAEVKLPDVEVKKPAVEVDIKVPGIDLKSSDAEGSPSKMKLPTFKLPKFGISTSEVSVEVPDKDIKVDGADMKLEGVKVEAKLPDVEIKEPSGSISLPQAPEAEVDLKSRKTSWSMPRFSFSMGSGKAPEADINLEAPKVDVTIPEVKTDVDFEIKDAPSVSVEGVTAPDVDAKLKKPRFSLPKISFSKQSIKEPEFDVTSPKVEVSLAAGTVEVKQPDIEFKQSEGEMELDGQKSKFKFPSLGFKGPEVDLSVSQKDVDVTLPEMKAEVKLPHVEVKQPSAEVEIKSPDIKVSTKDTDGSPSKFKMPSFKMPKFGVGTPSVTAEVPEVDKDVKIDGGDIKVPEEILTVEVAAPKIDIKGPSIDIKAKEPEQDRRGSKFRFPSLGFKGPDVDLTKKEVDVKLPEVKAEVKLPDVEVKKPAAEVEIKSPEIKLTTKDTDGSPSKFKMPSFKMPKFGVGTPNVSAEVPDMDKDVKIDGGDIKIPEEVLTLEVAAPKIDIKGPSIDVKSKEPEQERRGSKFRFPSLGFKGPDVDITKKEVDVKLPEVKAEVKLPDVEVKKPAVEVDIKVPGIDLKSSDAEGSPSKMKLPTFKLPKFGISTPEVSVEVPDKDIKVDGADMKLEGVKVEAKLPDVEIKEPSGSISLPQAPEAEVDLKSRKTSWTMPRFSFSMGSGKAPEADINLEAPKVDVTIPEVKTDVDFEIKDAPSVSVEGVTAPDVDAKLKKPRFSLPKISFSKQSIKEPEFDVTSPKVEVSLAAGTVEVKQPDIEFKQPEGEMELDGQKSKFKFPSLGFKGPEVDLSVSQKDMDVTLPEMKAEVKLPDVEVKQPSAEVEIKSPEIKLSTKDTDGSPSKFKMPSFKMPKFGVGTPSVTAEVPNIEKDVKIDGGDIKVPEKVLTVEVAAPKIDIKGQSIDVKTKEPEQERRGSKFKFPSLGFKGPDIELSASKKDVDVTLPEVKAEVKLPDAEVKKPAAEVEIKSPEIKLTTKDRDGSPSKFKMPSFKMPKFGVGTPEVPDMDKDVQIDGGDIKIPEEVLTVEVAAPKIDIKGPSIDVKSKEPEQERRGSKFRFPSLGFKGPDVDITKKEVDVKLPEVKAEVKLPDVDVKKPAVEVDIKVPGIDLKSSDAEGSPSKMKLPTFKLPKFGVSTPEVSVEVPDKDIKVDKGDVKLEGVKVEAKLPDVEIKEPSGSISLPQAAEAEVDLKSRKTSWTMPRFSFSMGSGKAPEADINLEAPKVDVTIPEVKTDVDFEIKDAPSVSVEGVTAPDVDAKLKKPRFSLPKISFSKQSIKEPEFDVTSPKVEVSLAAGTVEVKQPDIEFKQPEGEMELDGQKSKFKFPSLGFKGPEVDLSVSQKDVDVTLPEMKAEVKLPHVEVKQPSAEVEIKSPEIKLTTKDTDGSPSKFKMPSFKMPKFGVGTPSITAEVPEVDKDVKIDGGDIKVPEEILTVEVAAPKIDIKGQSIDIKAKEPEQERRGSKFRFPSLGFKSADVDFSASKKEVDATLPELKAEVKLPEVKVKKPSAEVEINSPEIKLSTKDTEESPSKFKMPSFKLPKFGGGTSNVSSEIPIIDQELKIEGADIKIPEEVLTVEVAAPNVDVKGPSIDIKTKEPEQERRGSKFRFPSLGFKGPDVDVKKKEVDVSLSEVKAEVTVPEVKLEHPSTKVKIKAPGFKAQATDKSKDLSVNVKAPGEIEGSGSKFKLPNFGLSMPKVEEPDTDVHVTLPEGNVEIKLPEVEVKESEGAVSEPTLEAEVKAKRPSWTFPRFSFSKSSGKVPDADMNLETPKVDITLPEVKAKASLPVTEVKGPKVKEAVKDVEMEIKASELDVGQEGQEGTIKLPKISMAKGKVSQKEVDITLPEVKAEIKLSEGEVKETDGKSKDAGGSPLKFKMPTVKMPKFGGASLNMTMEGPGAEKVTETDDTKSKEDMHVTIKGPSVDIKTDVSKAATPDLETPKTEMEDVGSPSKFKLPSFKMPRLSFSRTKSEEEYAPIDTEHKEDQQEGKDEKKGKSKSPTVTSIGEILKAIDVEFDVSKVEKIEDSLETSKEAQQSKELAEKQVDQDATKSPERTGWFKFRFGLSSPSEPPKTSEQDPRKDKKSPTGETGDDDFSPSSSVQSSDAFADISSAVTSELVGPSLSSPTKVTVKYSDPKSATGPVESQSNITTSMARTELISDVPDLPEKITILSSSVSSSSEDTLQLKSGKIHVITSNIQGTPESQHGKLLTAIQVQPAGGLAFTSEANEAAGWTVEDSQGGKRTVFERHLLRETSSERAESKETVVITKQITHVFESSEPISGETASSIQRLRDTVHTEKMKFFDEAEK